MKALFTHNVSYNLSDSGVIIPHYVNIECEGGDAYAIITTILLMLVSAFVGWAFKDLDNHFNGK